MNPLWIPPHLLDHLAAPNLEVDPDGVGLVVQSGLDLCDFDDDEDEDIDDFKARLYSTQFAEVGAFRVTAIADYGEDPDFPLVVLGLDTHGEQGCAYHAMRIRDRETLRRLTEHLAALWAAVDGRPLRTPPAGQTAEAARWFEHNRRRSLG